MTLLHPGLYTLIKQSKLSESKWNWRKRCHVNSPSNAPNRQRCSRKNLPRGEKKEWKNLENNRNWKRPRLVLSLFIVPGGNRFCWNFLLKGLIVQSFNLIFLYVKLALGVLVELNYSCQSDTKTFEWNWTPIRRTIVDFKQFITFQLSHIEGSSIELDCLSCVGSILKIDFSNYFKVLATVVFLYIYLRWLALSASTLSTEFKRPFTSKRGVEDQLSW